MQGTMKVIWCYNTNYMALIGLQSCVVLYAHEGFLLLQEKSKVPSYFHNPSRSLGSPTRGYLAQSLGIRGDTEVRISADRRLARHSE
jgi:hypothetical protein